MTGPTRIFSLFSICSEKPASLLVTKHAEGARNTRGNGRKAVEELESKFS